MAAQLEPLPQFDDLEDIFRDPDGAPDGAEEPETAPPIAPTEKKPRRLPLGLVAFVGGLLVGWLVIGWWLWPVQWIDTAPWQLDPQYQRTFVALVAEEYWRTSDVFRAKELLAGWNRQDLNKLLAAMRNEATNAETRRRLAALAEALEMPGSETSLLAMLFSQTGLILSAILALAPILAAVILVASPLMRKAPPEALPVQEGLSEAALEELLGDVQLEEQQVQEQQALEGQALSDEKETDETDEGEAEQQEQEEGGSLLGDLVSLFEEEDTSLSSLEAFCKGLPDIALEELVTFSANVSKRLREANATNS